MTTPKSHRPWRDRLRDTVDRVDTWITGAQDDEAIPWTDFLPQEILDAEIEATPTERFVKVSPNVDHTPPPPIVTHPECATLTDDWAQKQAEADATVSWADDFRWWWDHQLKTASYQKKRTDRLQARITATATPQAQR